MKFTYTAITPEGERISGETTAQDKFELARVLKHDGKILTQAESKEDGGGLREALERINTIVSRVSAQDKILFAKNLSAMVAAGLPLSRAMSVLRRQTKNEKFKLVVGDIESGLQGGGSLSANMKTFPRVFSPLFVAMVHAGEESGNLAKSLALVGDQLQKQHELLKKIRGALIYPGIIIAAMIIVGVLMLVYVVPTLTETFEDLGVELPVTTRAIIAASDFLTHNALLSLIFVVAFVVASFFAMRTPRGTSIFHRAILRVPIVGTLTKKINSARTARTLSSLLSSGVDMVEALEITGEVIQNTRYKSALSGAQEEVQKGVALSKVFEKHKDLYPVLVPEMTAVGEETGKLADMLEQTAIFYEGEIEETTKNLSTIIEPVLMIVVGSVVGFFAVSMITPMYSLLNTI